MHLNDLHPAAGSKKAKRRVGVVSSGFGKLQLVARKARRRVQGVAFDPVSRADSYRCRCVYLSLVFARELAWLPRKCGLAS